MDYKDLVERAVMDIVSKEVEAKVLQAVDSYLECIIREVVTPQWLRDVVQETIEYQDSITDMIVQKATDEMYKIKVKLTVEESV